MVGFTEVAPEEVPNFTRGHRGRVSYPIIKAFLETGFAVAKVDRTDLEQTASALYTSLRYYSRKHKLPLSVFMREGEVYMARLDIDDDGEVMQGSNEALKGAWDEHKKARLLNGSELPAKDLDENTIDEGLKK